jgi:hypothetical protein
LIAAPNQIPLFRYLDHMAHQQHLAAVKALSQDYTSRLDVGP